MEGPDVELYARFRRLTGRPVIASGGVGSVADLRTLAGGGVEAAIVGRALYEGRMSLPDALRALRGEGSPQHDDDAVARRGRPPRSGEVSSP